MKRKDMRSLANRKYNKDQDWRNEHGQPNFDYLQNLANENTPSSLEKLRSIAEDLDVSYDSNSSNEELIDEILASVRSDPTVTT